MKNKIFATMAVFAFCFSYAPVIIAQSVNELVVQLASIKSTDNAQQTTNFLKDVEMLWKTNPLAYLDFQTKAAAQLSGANQDVVLTIFNNVMDKNCPTNIIIAQDYFQKKTDFASKNDGLIESLDDGHNLLKLAYFLGEIRSNMIPGYVIQPNMMNSGGMDMSRIGLPHSPVDTNAVEQENLKNATNNLQSTLVLLNSEITIQLINGSIRFFNYGHPASNFLNQIVSAAHLTIEESKKIKNYPIDSTPQ